VRMTRKSGPLSVRRKVGGSVCVAAGVAVATYTAASATSATVAVVEALACVLAITGLAIALTADRRNRELRSHNGTREHDEPP
jgi:hypothetical protein